jgi:hypothetical protein
MDPKIAGYMKGSFVLLALIACTLLATLGKMTSAEFTSTLGVLGASFLGAMGLSAAASSIGAGMQAKAAAQIASVTTPLVGQVVELKSDGPKGGAA